jgi:hypothetical protein
MRTSWPESVIVYHSFRSGSDMELWILGLGRQCYGPYHNGAQRAQSTEDEGLCCGQSGFFLVRFQPFIQHINQFLLRYSPRQIDLVDRSSLDMVYLIL